MSTLTLPSCAALTRYAEPAQHAEPLPRQRGRPKTRTAAHYADLIEAHRLLSAWFKEAKGRPAASDIELLTVFFATNLQQRNLRASRIDSSEIQGRLKTLRNEFSQARRLTSERPNKSTINGTH